MSEDANGLAMRQSPRKRTGDLNISDFTMMVRVPGRPAAVAVYTDAERDEAARYAAEVGGEILSLPLAPPAGYIAGASGSLVPIAPPTPG
jgi:hypothetical protein